MKIKVVRFWPFRPSFVAITIPPWGVLMRKSWHDEASEARRLKVWRHETAHWEQYEQRGLLRFYAEYAWLSIRYGYKNHPMEIEARKAAAQ